MTDDENDLSLEKKINKQVRRLLKAALADTDFDSCVRPIVDEEDGETYYVIEPTSKLQKRHIDAMDAALIASARLFSGVGIPNRSKFYRRVARMVHYAYYETETRTQLENLISTWTTEEIVDV